ncbi:MAG: decarboxylating NADP(+)-dependent phosphogluconate dehydrogenase [Acidimicrobiia bacterium]|nr:decarboxylating NADP(+)-dependent phosphogluconate dehydrogenase [Acidimicrobiia bacterium]
MEPRADLGLIGLAVMGQNLVLNMDDHGHTVAVYNRTASKVEEFLAGPADGTRVVGTDSLESLVAAVTRPRKIMLMIKAGEAVDAVIDQLIPLLDRGDVIIDGGNSYFQDTIRRTQRVEEAGMLYVGMGVSGGEEGARHGPSMMPGGSPGAWPLIKEAFQAIAARVADGTPTCDWVGPDGAGHYVKMVHNGIEYGDMQVIAEAYHLMHSGAGLSHDELVSVFDEWSEGVLDSYLIDITADIMAARDADGTPLLDQILDAAGQKGTGKWTATSALDLGMPVTLVAEAVFARIVSALKDQRISAGSILKGPSPHFDGDRRSFVDQIGQALYASKIVSYAQGFMLMSAAADEYGWELDYGRIAGLWREGCIIRAAFLDDITAAYADDPDLENLLLAPYFVAAIDQAQSAWREVVATAVRWGIPVPAYSSALAFFDGYRSERLPANLLQAQRDYFGAHTYERVDRPRGEHFHTDWTGRGGSITAGTYDA